MHETANGTVVAWTTLAQQKLTIDPNISALTGKYSDTCKRTGQLADAFWKRCIAFLPPHILHQIHYYNLKYGKVPKYPQPNPQSTPLPIYPPYNLNDSNNPLNIRYHPSPNPLFCYPNFP